MLIVFPLRGAKTWSVSSTSLTNFFLQMGVAWDPRQPQRQAHHRPLPPADDCPRLPRRTTLPRHCWRRRTTSRAASACPTSARPSPSSQPLPLSLRASGPHGNVFKSRLLGRNTVFLAGIAGAEAFYNDDNISRTDAHPPTLVDLFGGINMEMYDGPRHHDLKSMALAGFDTTAIAGDPPAIQDLAESTLARLASRPRFSATPSSAGSPSRPFRPQRHGPGPRAGRRPLRLRPTTAPL